MVALNGWQRLWVVFMCAWGVMCVGIGIAIAPTVWRSGNISPGFALLGFAVVPPVLLYAVGLGVAWVRRGFQQSKA
jgi:hypothetical protein